MTEEALFFLVTDNVHFIMTSPTPCNWFNVDFWRGKTVSDYLRMSRDLSIPAYSTAVKQLVGVGESRQMRSVSRSPAQQAHYVACVLSGVDDRLAEMFALGTPPMSNTDREFLEGHANGNQFEKTPAIGDYYAGVAKRNGVDPKGKVYLSSLAAYPGDPQAWVTGRGDVQKVCEERGWSCRGAVNVKMREAEPASGKYRVADDIVNNRAEELMQSGIVSRTEDAVEKAREQLTPVSKW